MNKTFLTIRETAKTGILSEYTLRLMQKQGKIPCIMCGNKCMVNYPLLLEQLNTESKKAVISNV
ncbi:MAG: hypothetical protein E7415_01430 [Ruminococcaceae bacterium]|nr:hypothetical protein [Oscillospiraceae bacterium]